MVGDYEIEWVTEPEVTLLKSDGHWNTFRVTSSGKAVIDGVFLHFPVGWETDVTSTPRWVRGFLPQLGPWAPAALIHDRLLVTHSRKYARRVMWSQLKLLPKVSRLEKFAMYSGVRLCDFVESFRHAIKFAL